MSYAPESSIPPQIAQEAAHIYFELIKKLHAVDVCSSQVLFSLEVSHQLADRMAACGSSIEDDEDSDTSEDDHRCSPRIDDFDFDLHLSIKLSSSRNITSLHQKFSEGE